MVSIEQWDQRIPNARGFVRPEWVVLSLRGTTKEEIIGELVEHLDRNGCLTNREQVLADVLRREAALSTGLSDGIALPRAQSEGVRHIAVMIGIKPAGVDFDSLDGQKTRIFLMTVAPPRSAEIAYYGFLAAAGELFRDPVRLETILAATSPEEVTAVLTN